MRCKTCGYLLENLTGGRCPECGRGFDPEIPATYLTAAQISAHRRWRRRTVAGFAAYAAVLAIAAYVLRFPILLLYNVPMAIVLVLGPLRKRLP